MKTVKAAAVLAAASLTLAACSDDSGKGGDSTATETKTSTATSSSEAPEAQQPTAQELTDTLNRAVDPNVPTDQKLDTVVGGQEAPQLFDALTQASQSSGSQLQVEDPVLPGAMPETVNATVRLTLPEQEPQVISGVEFANQDGKWKLDQRWACTLVENVVPDQVPPMCAQYQGGGQPQPGQPQPGQPEQNGQPEQPAQPAPEGAGAPAPAPAPQQ